MATINVQADLSLEAPTLIEGLPGVGLVGKIATDHLVTTYDMTYYAGVECEGIPPVSIYHTGKSKLRPPVRLYADEDRDLLVLSSDIPISPQNAETFAGCVTGWIAENDVLPVFLTGLAREQRETSTVPELFGVATGDGEEYLDRGGIVPPRESGLVRGPTGALLHTASEMRLTSVGLIVTANPQFPDPTAAKALLDNGIAPVAGIDVETDSLVEQAEEIQQTREQLAKQLHQENNDKSSQAQPLRGFQ